MRNGKIQIVNMSKKLQPKPEVLEEYIRTKEEFQEQYNKKKLTQKQAKQRREFIRELKEDRDWE
jgi:hypothetical protein